jgi:hypothetical protein
MLYTFLADTRFFSIIWMIMGLIMSALIISGIIALALSFYVDWISDDHPRRGD